MAELTVRQGELVVTMEPREKRSFTRFFLCRASQSQPASRRLPGCLNVAPASLPRDDLGACSGTEL